MSVEPGPRDLVLVGGGHTHLHVLAAFGRQPEPGVRVTLISREPETAYSGMLPGLAAGFYSHAEAHVALEPLARAAGARFIRAEVDGIDRAARELRASGERVARYDLLSLDTGSLTDLSVPGADQHAVPVKPVPDFLAAWGAIRRAARVEMDAPASDPVIPGLAAGENPEPTTGRSAWSWVPGSASQPRNDIVVVGGGIGGAELALALRAGLIASGVGRAVSPITLVARAGLAPELNARARRMLAAALDRNGIDLATDADIVAVRSDAAIAADGRAFPFAHLFFATWAAAPDWLRATDLALDARGFVAVDETLRALGAPDIFAAGDVAAMLAHPRPKSGVFAVRQGPPLAANLRRALRGEAPRPFVPQSRALKLIGAGDGRAIAAWGGVSAEGTWLWWLKRRIDRRWIARYQIP